MKREKVSPRVLWKYDGLPQLSTTLLYQVETVSIVTSAKKITFELELIQTQMAQKPMLRAEVGMRVRCANKASAE
jgi:hypothetical protein